MKFKQFVNEGDELESITNVLNEIYLTLKHRKSVHDWDSIFVKHLKDLGKLVGNVCNKSFTVYDRDGKKLDMTENKLVRYGVSNPDHFMGWISVLERNQQDIYKNLYDDGNINFGFTNLFGAMDIFFKSGKEINDEVRTPVFDKTTDEVVRPFVEERSFRFIEWLENVIKESKKILKKVFGDSDASGNPLSFAINACEEILKKYGTVEKLVGNTEYGYNIVSLANNFYVSPQRRNEIEDLGGKDVKFWTDILDGFAKELEEIFVEEESSEFKKWSRDYNDTFVKGFAEVLSNTRLKGKSFVVMTGLIDDDRNDSYVYEIDNVSDIEDIKEIFQERRVKARKDYEERRKRDEENRKKNDWYARYGSRYDF